MDALIALIVILVVVVFLINSVGINQKKQEFIAQLNPSAVPPAVIDQIGEYVMGHPEIDSAGMISMAITNDDLVLFDGVKLKQVGTIPRSSVKEVSIEDRSSIQQKVTAGRVLVLGVFALAAKKNVKMNEFFIVIEWVDSKGRNHPTTFRKEGVLAQSEANATRNKLLKYI